MNNLGQITIFVIIAIVIIAAVIGVFLLAGKNIIKINQPSIIDPQQYIDKCAKDSAAEAIRIMLPQGGYITPRNYKLYEDNKIEYLCYNNLYYLPCKVQEPMYMQRLESEITNYSAPLLEECFQSLKLELEKQNYIFEMGKMNVTTELLPNTIRMNIIRDVSLSRQGETRKFQSFKSTINSPLYNLARVAIEIANQESRFCHFEYTGFMILYPDYSIDKEPIGSGQNSSKIYIIGDRNTGKKLNIAIRSCAIPAGF